MTNRYIPYEHQIIKAERRFQHKRGYAHSGGYPNKARCRNCNEPDCRYCECAGFDAAA